MNIKISCPPRAAEPVSFAAEQLSTYLGQMLADEAGTLPISLSVHPDREGGLPDWFSVELTPESGSIEGSCSRAVLLGVYDCLRRLGCRFLAPVKGCEVVPSIPREVLSLRYEHRASSLHRGVCIEGADSRENVLDFIDWLPKLGYNSFFLQFKSPCIFFARWYQHRGNSLRDAEPFTQADALAWAGEAERELKRRGLLLHKVGHGWTGEVLGCEAQSWDADTQPLPEEKRTLAAQVGGVRGLYKGVAANTNLCFSSGDTVDSFAALVADYAEKNPGVDYLHVWLADEYNNVCECESCQTTTPSDQYVALLNEIDRRLTAQGLDTKIVFLLYQELLWPPAKARLVNPRRFVLMFAPISRTFERSYEADGELPSIPPYRRNHIALPTSLSQNLAFLRDWQKIFQGDSFIYDYPLGRAHYGDFGYMKLARVISGDVKRLREFGLAGYVSCQELRAGLPNFFPNYVLGRTLMDASLDVNQLMGEYFSAAYGEDWPLVTDYLSQLSALSSTDYVNGKGPRMDDGVASRLEAVRELCLGFPPTLDVHRTPQGWQNPFWRALDFHRNYVLKLSRALYCLAQGDEDGGAEGWQEFRQFICENEPDFQPWLDVYRVLEVTKNYTGFRPRQN